MSKLYPFLRAPLSDFVFEFPDEMPNFPCENRECSWGTHYGACWHKRSAEERAELTEMLRRYEEQPNYRTRLLKIARSR